MADVNESAEQGVVEQVADPDVPAEQIVADHSKDELVQAAEQAGVEVKSSDTKADIVATLSEPGDSVTFTQPAHADPPSHPLPSDSKGPLDALAGTEQDSTPLSAPHLPATGAESPTVGPEDALDPAVDNALDYGGRVDDAAHFTHEPVPEEELTVDGPRSRPVAQNQAAVELANQAEGPAPRGPGRGQ